jgi:small-conductance mechanosensitive channel
MVINNTGITWKEKCDIVSEDSRHDAVRHAVFQKFVGGVIYITVLSVVLFPILYHFGFNFLYLLCGYLYVIGFGSLCLLPINIMCEMSNKRTRNLHSPRNVLPLLLLLPAIGGYVLISGFINETTWQTAVVLIILSVLSLMVYKPMALVLLKRYDK